MAAPSGIYTTGYLYSDKKNPYETLKSFLLDTNSGRTDVVFFGEKNLYRREIDAADTATLGGFADAFASICMNEVTQIGTTSRRSMYGSPIYNGIHNQPARIDEPQYLTSLQTNDWQSVNNTTDLNSVNTALCGSTYHFDALWYLESGGIKRLPINFNPLIASQDTFIIAGVYNPASNLGYPALSAFGYSGYAASFGSPIVFSNNYDAATTIGPYAIPVFESQPNFHWLKKDSAIAMRIGRSVNGVVTELWYTQEIRDVHEANLPEAQWLPPISVGDSVSSLTAQDPRIIDDAAGIRFVVSTEDFLIPLLVSLGWTVCTTGCDFWTQDYDVYKIDNFFVQGTTRPVWVFKRNLPFNFHGSNSMFAITSKELADKYDLKRYAFVSTESVNEISAGLNQHIGLPALDHWAPSIISASMGSIRINFSFEYAGTGIPASYTALEYSGTNVTNFRCPLWHLNPATSSLTTQFYWNGTWDTSVTQVKKDKFVKMDVKKGKTLMQSSYEGAAEIFPGASFKTFAVAEPKEMFAFAPGKKLKLTVSGLSGTDIGTGRVFGDANIRLTLVGKNAGGTTTIRLIDQNVVLEPSPQPEGYSRKFASVERTLASEDSVSYVQATNFRFSIFGYDSADVNARTAGYHYINNYWLENPDDLNGISFHFGHITEDFRSGDVIYGMGRFGTGNAQGTLGNLFASIAERQKNQARKKLVICLMGHRHDAASPGDIYLGGTSSTYINSIKDVEDLAKGVGGFTSDEIVILVIEPLPCAHNDIFSEELAAANANIANRIQSFQKTRFIWYGNLATNSKGGCMTPRPPWTNAIDFNAEHYIPNSVFVSWAGMANNYIPDLESVKTQLFQNDLNDALDYFTPNDGYNLLKAQQLFETLIGAQSNPEFVPWLTWKSQAFLGIDTDPINNYYIFNSSPSSEVADFGSNYFDDMDTIIREGNATSTIRSLRAVITKLK